MEHSAEPQTVNATETPASGVTTHWIRSLSVGVGFLLLALMIARGTSAWIAIEFPNRPVPRDLLFEVLPHVPQAGMVADIALVAALFLLLVYALCGNQRDIPKMLALFGIMEIARAVLNVMTPLGSPLRSPFGTPLSVSRYYGLMHVSQNGEFPSGHMASVFLIMLLIDKEQAPRLRATAAALVVVECVALLVSHQHYAIDVVGGLMLSYIVYYEYAKGTWLNWLKPLVTV